MISFLGSKNLAKIKLFNPLSSLGIIKESLGKFFNLFKLKFILKKLKKYIVKNFKIKQKFKIEIEFINLKIEILKFLFKICRF